MGFEIKSNDFGADKPVKTIKAENDEYDVTVFDYEGDISVTAKPKKDALPLSYMSGHIIMSLPAIPVMTRDEAGKLKDAIGVSIKSADELEDLLKDNL